MTFQVPSQGFTPIERIIANDPGGRGIAPLVRPGELHDAAELLIATRSVLIVTGFFIPAGGACETDGPPGAWALGDALASLGIEVGYVTDAACLPVLGGAGMTPLIEYDPNLLTRHKPTALVSIERVGRAADGKYYNMRGKDIGAFTAPVDDMFLQANAAGIPTIGIGDGGNEIGMGNVRELVAANIKLGPTIACVVPTTHLIVAGVSNWGAWGLVAGLSLLCGRNLLPTVEQARRQLDAIVAAGAVDGVTARPEATVDGLSWERQEAILRSLLSIVQGITTE